MARILSISNQKGGVGKTTTAVNLAASLALLGRRVLLLDLDPQGNATSGLGIDKGSVSGTLYDALVAERPLAELVVDTAVTGLSIVPATTDLVGAEVELTSALAREQRLSDAIAPIAQSYDDVVIDCPPSLGLLTLNALTAADSVLIPIQSEYFALEGLSELVKTCTLVQRRLNPRLRREGILLTLFDGRNRLNQQVADEVRRHFGAEVFDTVIPRNVRLAEAPSHGEPIHRYDPRCPGARAYGDLCQEILTRRAGSVRAAAG
jgi:chromosome partitioning protein